MAVHSPAPLGTHLILDLWGLDPDLDADRVRKVMREAALQAGATILHDNFHDFDGRDGQPGGFTGVLVLAESHMSIHTWPEADYAAIDIFTCGESAQPHRACEFLVRRFGARTHTLKILSRGAGTIEGAPEHDNHPAREAGLCPVPS